MTRQDPGAANGSTVRQVRRCVCGRMETLHPIRRGGGRGAFRAAGCTGFQPASNLITFPGAGIAPAPAGPPTPLLDLDAVADRYAAYCQARDAGRHADAALLAAACVGDIPALRDELRRVEMLRRELAAELDRVTGHA